MIDQIKREITDGSYYQQNFANDGQRFVAWHLRRVLLRDAVATRDDITDGANDKQIDAIIVEDEERRVIVIQGKFIDGSPVDGEPLREVLGAWMRLQDLPSLQKDANDKLKVKLEAVRRALEDDYRVDFELITTGALTDAARGDLKAFAENLEKSDDFEAGLHLIDTDVLKLRLAEAEAQELPSLDHAMIVDPASTLVTKLGSAQTVLAVLPLKECLRLPGIKDGRLFRKNVRQSLGMNKVNRALKDTINNGDRVREFFFYHNGVTALCDSVAISDDGKTMNIKGLSVVNGCQSLSTIFSVSERVRSSEASDARILFRLYEIPDRALGDRISINTNSQTQVKPRDLKSNDKVLVGLKRAYEIQYPDGYLLTKRGEERPANRDAAKTIDTAILGKMLMAWHCQRPNISYNEKRLFDDHYKTLFRTGYNPASMLALQTWLNAIEDLWSNFTFDDTIKAGKGYAKYHVLFVVSAIIARANKQQLVVEPAATLKAAQQPTEILTLAASCLDNALQNAINTQPSGKLFSPMNWLKAVASVNAESLAASTVATMIPGWPNGKELMKLMTVPATSFVPRWSAE